MSEKKEKIRIMIDKYDSEDGNQFYRVCDGNDYNLAADCCSGGGWYLDQYQIDYDIQEWEKEYNIEIVEDYR